MKRLAVAVLALALLAAPLVAEGQVAGRVTRIGWLFLSPAPVMAPNVDALRNELLDLGYVEGKNLVFEIRSAEGKPDRLPEVAAQLIRLKVDVIVTTATQTALAASLDFHAWECA